MSVIGLRLAFAVACVAALPGCHHRLSKLNAQGRHDEVVDRAESSRFGPRDKAARAYAASLHALGQSQRAVDTLQRDYRRGGNVASLVAMADLERELGLSGLAAHHYVRVMTHDRDALRGRVEVCAMFRERARGYLGAAEGEAADADARRAAYLCPSAADAALLAATDAAAKAQVDARIATGQCTPPCERTTDPGGEPATSFASAKALLHARTAAGVQLSAEEMVAVMLADVRGELGPYILDDDTLRARVGGQGWGALAPIVMSSTGPVAAYLQLRLAPILDDLPQAPGVAGTRERDRWTNQALRIPGVEGWRVYAVQGDLSTAELELAATWRSASAAAAAPQEPSTADPSADATVPTSQASEALAPKHWSARLPIDADTLDVALVAARLRGAAGRTDLALSLLRWALVRGRDLPLADDRARFEVVRALAWGRPWQALALLETGAVVEPSSLRAAASTAIVLARTLCGGSCREDVDIGVVTRVMGESWVQDTQRQLLGWALAHRTAPPDALGCPTVAEVMASDARGPLPEALRAARTNPSAPGVADGLVRALSSDLRSWCAGSLALPVLAHGRHQLGAARLSESLAHVPEMQASLDLQVHAKLAMIAGEDDRAELLAIAAGAAAVDARAVWHDLARFAATAGMRELELRALRETLLQTPNAAGDAAIRHRLVVLSLRDVFVSWGQDRPAGADASRRHVTSAIDALAAEARWEAMETLLASVRADLDATGRTMTAAQQTWLTAALLGEDEEAQAAHARALARLLGQDPGRARGPLDPSGTADDVAGQRLGEVPALTVALADPLAFEATRVALARDARDWSVRRRMGASLLALGSASGRRVGWSTLASMAAAGDAAQGEALTEVVVQRPAALEPEPGAAYGHPRKLVETAAIDDPQTLLSAVVGLDLSSPVVAP